MPEVWCQTEKQLIATDLNASLSMSVIILIYNNSYCTINHRAMQAYQRQEQSSTDLFSTDKEVLSRDLFFFPTEVINYLKRSGCHFSTWVIMPRDNRSNFQKSLSSYLLIKLVAILILTQLPRDFIFRSHPHSIFLQFLLCSKNVEAFQQEYEIHWKNHCCLTNIY